MTAPTWCPDIGHEPYFISDHTAIFHGDCAELLALFPDAFFTHAITDPPYSKHVHSNARTNKGTDGGSGGAEHDLGFGHLTPAVRALVAHHLRRLVTRWCLVFCDTESTHLWRRDLCEEEDRFVTMLTIHNEQPTVAHEYLRTGIWLKDGAMPQVTGDRPGSGYESIVISHAHRAKGSGRTRWNGGGRSNVWRERVPQKRDGRVHPSEKPWPLLTKLLLDFTEPGDVVLDPFAGSGSLARAGIEVRKRAGVGGPRVVLIEADEQWCAQAASRLGGRVPDAATGQTGLQW